MCLKYPKLNAIFIPILIKTPFDTDWVIGGGGGGRFWWWLKIYMGEGRDQTCHFSNYVICEHIHQVLTSFEVVHMGEWETAEHH